MSYMIEWRRSAARGWTSFAVAAALLAIAVGYIGFTVRGPILSGAFVGSGVGALSLAWSGFRRAAKYRAEIRFLRGGGAR